jgi:hypothetical protein
VRLPRPGRWSRRGHRWTTCPNYASAICIGKARDQRSHAAADRSDRPDHAAAVRPLVAAKMGSRAQLVEFPYVGHDIEESTPCGASLVTQFIRYPEAPLDMACVAEVLPVAFR